jgi:hypothetical protein
VPVLRGNLLRKQWMGRGSLQHSSRVLHSSISQGQQLLVRDRSLVSPQARAMSAAHAHCLLACTQACVIMNCVAAFAAAHAACGDGVVLICTRMASCFQHLDLMGSLHNKGQGQLPNVSPVCIIHRTTGPRRLQVDVSARYQQLISAAMCMCSGPASSCLEHIASTGLV